ncbi:MAG: hypothetical protein J4N87_07865, partial [Chloroflexi bacterium]|nr:hypothetical protein [Chloroflexota bacterium]
MPGILLGPSFIARRAAQELFSGAVVALGPGMPCGLPSELRNGSGVWLLSDNGFLGFQGPGTDAADGECQTVVMLPGGVYTGVVEIAGILRGGHTDIAVLQPAQVSANGDFVHWTTAATQGVFAPGPAVDMAYGASKVVAVMTHQGLGGQPNIVARCSLPVDGAGQIDIIITDAAVINVGQDGLELVEIAPGWTAEEVVAITGAPLIVSSDLKEMTFEVPTLEPPNKVYPSAVEALKDVPEGAIINVDGFAGPGGMAHYLMVGLRDLGVKGLHLISNTAGVARVSAFGSPNIIDHSILVENNQVAKATASYPVSP